MSSFGLDSAGASPMTSEKPAASPPLSASQIDALVETVCRALARGQSVVVMSEGRILARYLPGRPDAGGTAEAKDEVDRKR